MIETTPRLTLSNTKAMTINLVIAVLYLLFGLSAEFLSIPPDYATPVWPAAGIALGFALRYGSVVYPGIFVGALLANSVIAYLQGIPFSFDQFGFATLIATGATIQAAFTRFLLLKAKISPTQLKNGNEIAKFLILAGPAGCLVNSINGATQLGLFNIVPWDFWFTNWLTWWVGDSVGALVITPFALRMLSSDTDGKQTWNAALMSMTFLGLVILSFLYVRELEQENRKAQVAETGDHMAVIFQSHIYEMSVILDALKAFYESSSFVDLEEFDHFSSLLMKSQKAIHVLEWLPYITHDKRADLENYLRENGYPQFRITKRELNGTLVEQTEQPDYMPIAYAYPYKGNEKIHGMDVLALPYREPQSRLALETGKAYASAPLKLVQEKEGQTAYILLKAVENYQGEGYTGLVQTIFRVNDLVDETMGQASDLEGLTITDITEPTKPTIIYGHKHEPNDYAWNKEFEFQNRKLSVSLTPSLALLKRVSSWQSYTLLIGGLLYVAMLEAVLLSLLTRQHAIQMEVETKTREIAQAKEEAEQASKAKTDFLASMSHELRTPLNAVIGFTHRVVTQKNNNLDERNREALQIVEKNANHLLGLINNLLDITKVEKGRLELEYNKTNLNEVLSEAAKHFSLAASQKKNEIVFQSNQKTNATIEADTTRIRQVVMNLLSNAIKFTSNGTITITLDADDANAGYVIKIKDTGIGIADEDMPKLFNKFEKVGNTSKINPQGTGLGLALSKEIVDLHRGKIEAISKLHQGTTFTVWLPVSPDKKTNV